MSNYIPISLLPTILKVCESVIFNQLYDLSSEEEIEAFYNDLDDAYKQCGSQKMVVVMGDLNVKVGTEQEPQKVVVGQHGERNERGDLWVDWCTTQERCK